MRFVGLYNRKVRECQRESNPADFTRDAAKPTAAASACRYEALQFLVEVLDDDQARRRCYGIATRRFDHQEALTVGRDVVRAARAGPGEVSAGVAEATASARLGSSNCACAGPDEAAATPDVLWKNLVTATVANSLCQPVHKPNANTASRTAAAANHLVRAFFNEKELADLTLAVATINAWNRLAISARTVPGKYEAKKK